MRITLSNHIVTIAVGAAVLAAGAQALAAVGGSGSQPASDAVWQAATSAPAQAATIRHWTTTRMTAALRASGGLTGNTTGNALRWTHGGAITDAVGKVFFTLNDVDYVCSGVLVGGEHTDVVLTAAHCVTGGRGPDGTTEWATNWMFIPGYRDGQSPYGEYTARRFFVMSDWSGPTSGHEQYDIAFVQLAAGSRYEDSGTAALPLGLPISFAASQRTVPTTRAYVFGYPSLPPFTGLYPNYCAGPVAATDGSLRTSCGMTAGDSGGPWLAGFSPLSGSGKIVAVSTYKVSSNLSVLYGAVLGPQAHTLYARAVSSAR